MDGTEGEGEGDWDNADEEAMLAALLGTHVPAAPPPLPPAPARAPATGPPPAPPRPGGGGAGGGGGGGGGAGGLSFEWCALCACDAQAAQEPALTELAELAENMRAHIAHDALVAMLHTHYEDFTKPALQQYSRVFRNAVVPDWTTQNIEAHLDGVHTLQLPSMRRYFGRQLMTATQALATNFAALAAPGPPGPDGLPVGEGQGNLKVAEVFAKLMMAFLRFEQTGQASALPAPAARAATQPRR